MIYPYITYTQLAKMSFDKIFDLTAGVYFNLYNIYIYIYIYIFVCLSSGGLGRIQLNPFRAPEPLPILNTSSFVPKIGFPVVKGLSSPHFHLFPYTWCVNFTSIAFRNPAGFLAYPSLPAVTTARAVCQHRRSPLLNATPAAQGAVVYHLYSVSCPYRRSPLLLRQHKPLGAAVEYGCLSMSTRPAP